MKVEPLNKPIPFTEQSFNLVVTGTELALIKFLVCQCVVGNPNCVGDVAWHIYKQLTKYSGIDGNEFTPFLTKPIEAIPLNEISLEDFKETANKLAK